MSTLSKSLKAAAGNAGGDAPNVEDVFSTYLYDGNNDTPQTITNGIDLAGEGGMVWIKNRTGAYSHALFDTERGGGKVLSSDTTSQHWDHSPNGITSFNSDGFSVQGSGTSYDHPSFTYASWTFRKAPRFFDVVTYTGNGVAGREIAHDLGVDVGMILIKRTDSAESWVVFHKTQGVAYAELESTGAFYSGDVRWGSQLHSTTHFSLDDHAAVNGNGASYVAYLFAHDPVGENNDGMIACGSFNDSDANGATVDLGWEPQYIMIKRSSLAQDWYVWDTMRGIATGGDDKRLSPNTSAMENSNGNIDVTATGFKFLYPGGQDHIYMAIRGPMMVEPESGTDVFAIDTAGSGSSSAPQFNSSFAVDMAIKTDVSISDSNYISSRLTIGKRLFTDTAAAEATQSTYAFDYSDGWSSHPTANTNVYSWMFKRAKGFFDVVAYTGNGTAGRTVNHSLGVAPEMMWVKRRDGLGSWHIYHKDTGQNSSTHSYSLLFDRDVPAGYGAFAEHSAMVATTFEIDPQGWGTINLSGQTHISYLFATLDGVSKVGSFTGNGGSQNIACGFSAGARFVLIKRTDSHEATGDWFVWDTTRGIVAGNDPHLSLNTTAAQVTTDDSIDPQSSGFTVNQVTATNINVSSATYIFLAIA